MLITRWNAQSGNGVETPMRCRLSSSTDAA
jgi:hypothetical protein